MESKAEALRRQIEVAVAVGKVVVRATPNGWFRHSPDCPEGEPIDPPQPPPLAPPVYGEPLVLTDAADAND